MSIFKKFAAPLTAVALVATMGISLLSVTRTAEAAAITGAQVTITGSLSPTGDQLWNAITAPTKAVSTVTVTEVGAATYTAGDTITLTHTGYTLSGVTATGTAGALAGTIVGGIGTTVITLGGGDVTGAVDVIRITAANIAFTAVKADGTVVAANPAVAGTLVLPTPAITAKRMVIGWNTTTTVPATIDSTSPTFSADAAAVGGAICAWVADATGVATIGIPFTFTVSLGVVSTGVAKSTIVLSTGTGGTTGAGCTNYRGGGGIASTDTAIVSNSSINQVATLPITLTSPTGNTASKLAITAPTQSSVSATQTNVSPGYTSPVTGTNFSVQVTDSAGLGVNGQVILISVDKGALVAGFFKVCGTAKAVTGTGVTAALTPSGTAVAGTIQLTYCGNQNDPVGQATITASNISTSMANVSSTVATAGRPAKITAAFANGTVAATVTDANGNNVADGTPVQFTISSTAGAVSNTCTTTTSGKASSAVSLNSGSGSVIVTASYNESGSAAGCAIFAGTAAVDGTSFLTTTTGPGSQGVSTVVNIGTVVTPPATVAPVAVPASGAGSFASAPVYSASKQASVVFNGGTVAQLDAAITAAGGTGAWAQDSKGNFVAYIVGGGAVNAAFTAAFPTGFAGVTALTVIGK